MYHITDYSEKKAKLLGVELKPSTQKNKKIDVYKDGVKVVSIGDIRYLDYPNYILKNGLDYANQRRKLYLNRHKNDKGDAGYYAKNILW
jgi:hypothetical protein